MFRSFVCLLSLTSTLDGCGSCESPCIAPRSVVLVINGYIATSVQSNCSPVWSSLRSAPVAITATKMKDTCHIDVGLDDGQHVRLDVPFDQEGQQVCCSGSTTVYLSSVPAVEIDAPPGYVPRVDAGADATDASADAIND